MDWSLYRCGRVGHVTYAPDEPAIREHMRARTASGELLRCLRCDTFVAGTPGRSGPAADAPVIRRGKEIRSELILRVFAIERFLRFLLFVGVAFAIWQFRHSRLSIEQTFNRDLPIVKSALNELGFNVDKSRLLIEFRHVLSINQTTLTLIAVGVALFAVVELIEGIGLWLAKRWGEYFAMIVTSLGLPYEIYDLAVKVTVTRVALFMINLALVLYLLLSKRLFGVRGGKDAYDARLRSESVLQAATRQTAAKPAVQPDARPVQVVPPPPEEEQATASNPSQPTFPR